MTSRERSIFNILKASIVLFRDNGFDNTTVRQIAGKAGTSVGMINHYFGSKDYLGATVLDLIAQYTLTEVRSTVTIDSDPVLYDLVMNRVFFSFLCGKGYLQFYLDSLKNDFFFRFVDFRPVILTAELKKHYSFEATEDETTLYCRYMPYILEKTLMLKKSEGIFQSIDYAQIPYLTSTIAMSHFIPEAEIQSRKYQSIQMSAQIVSKLPATISDDRILSYLQSSPLTCSQG